MAGSLAKTFLAAAIANICALLSGAVMGWTSPTESKLPATTEEKSWVGSLSALGSAVGPIIGGVMADRVGRKWTLLGLAVPFLLGWILKGLAEPLDSLEIIYVARFIQGMAIGAVFTVLPMYSGEIAADSIRGAVGSFVQLFVSAGFLFEYCIGPYVSYIALIIASAVLPVVYGVALFFMPDSPYYLLAKGRTVAAQEALQWLRGGDSPQVEDELQKMLETVQETQRNKGSFMDLFKTRGNVKALCLSIGLVTFQQLSGINAVLFYTQKIFEMTGSSLDASIATIIIGVVMFLSSASTPFLVDRLGRRPLLLASAIGMTIGLAAMGAYFYMRNQDESSVSDIGFLPVVSMVLYIIVYSFGFGSLPWAVMGELFPANVKGFASSLTASVCWILGFLITKFFSNLLDAIGEDYTFWMFGIFCILAGFFVFFLLPETKGKSLQEIQDILNQ